MRLIAHRGFAAEHPENTLLALRRASRRADAVEVDVRRCGSGELVVVHDETVDRVTDATGRVADYGREELAALSVLGSGEGVPTLGEALDAVPASVGVNLELKECGLAADALSVAADRDTEAFVSSFSVDALRECRDADPAVPRAYLFADGDDDDAVDCARDLDCAFLHPHHDRCDADFVARAHDAGLAVNAWTVDDRATARRLADAGVDGVVADRRDVLDYSRI
ncbi:MAG: glycerophosphodiester phosphodiesterase [Haloplanus sp.]